MTHNITVSWNTSNNDILITQSSFIRWIFTDILRVDKQLVLAPLHPRTSWRYINDFTYLLIWSQWVKWRFKVQAKSFYARFSMSSSIMFTRNLKQYCHPLCTNCLTFHRPQKDGSLFQARECRVWDLCVICHTWTKFSQYSEILSI